MSNDSFSREVLSVQARLKPRWTFTEVHFKVPYSTAPQFKVSVTKLAKESTLFRRLLDEEAIKPENEGATFTTFDLMNVLPEIMRILLFWVEAGELLETHTFTEYSSIPVDEDTSPWMMMLRVYQAADRFEMPVLKAAIMRKILEMVSATDDVPCGTLKAIYMLTKRGDGLRKLMVDLTVCRVPSALYQTQYTLWGLEIAQDVLLAAKEAKESGGEEPFAKGLEKYV